MAATAPRREGTVTSFDGTRLGWQEFGQGPAVVLANGVGVSWRGMGPQIAHLAANHRVICWDYRGLGDSEQGPREAIALTTHARDALAVMDATEVGSAGLVGWSMGVQVVFEVAHLAPDRVHRIAGLGGVPYSPFRASLRLPVVHRIARRGIRHAARLAPLASPLLRRTLPRPAFFEVSKAIRYVRPQTDREAFLRMAHDVAHQDHRFYLRTLAALGSHDLRDRLVELTLPVLFLVGAKDLMIRPRTVKRVAKKLPNAWVHVVADCSHFIHVEAVDEVNAQLGRFFSDE